MRPRPDLSPGEWLEEAPAVGMTLSEARTFAASRSMRIPTFDEWMYCALGQRGRRAPAGSPQRGSANTAEPRRGARDPVGAFESGRTPDHGIYDLLKQRSGSGSTRGRQGLVDDRRRDPPGGGVSRAEAWCPRELPHPGAPHHTAGRVCLALEVAAGHRASDLGRAAWSAPRSTSGDSPPGRHSPARSGSESPASGSAGELRRLGCSAGCRTRGPGGAWVEALLAGASR